MPGADAPPLPPLSHLSLLPARDPSGRPTAACALPAGRDCINESLKHKTACPSCKLFARKRDVMRDFKIDRVATLYAQLEAASGQFVFCSPASRPAANAPPPQPAAADAAAAAFVVPSPPDSEFETAREDFGNAAEAPAFRLWAASPADAPAALTQDSAPSGAPPLLSQPPSTAARRQPPPSVRRRLTTGPSIVLVGRTI